MIRTRERDYVLPYDSIHIFMVTLRVESWFPRIVEAILRYVAFKQTQGKLGALGARPQSWRISHDTHTCD